MVCSLKWKNAADVVNDSCLLFADMLQLRRNRSWVERCASALFIFCRKDTADISIEMQCSAPRKEGGGEGGGGVSWIFRENISIS